MKNKRLENYFEVTIKEQGISKAMYKFLDDFEFDSIYGYYKGGGGIADNYDEFIKVYDTIKDNKVEAAWSTPAGKAIKSQLKDNYKPIGINILDNRIELFWIKIN